MMAIGAYAAFLLLAAALTTRVGLMLRHHGELLLRDRKEIAGVEAVWPGGERRIRSANGLTLIGYGLVTVGAVVLLLRIGGDPGSMIEGLAFLATRIGALLLVLGITQFYCLSAMSRLSETAAGAHRDRPAGRARPRVAREDPLDRVFEAARLDAPFGG